MATPPHRIRTAAAREAARINRLLRAEFFSGLLVMVAALAGFAAANSPLSAAYLAFRDTRLGPESLHLNLTIGAWSSDGLLAVFFFIVGLELKREFAFGALRRASTAVVPVLAAVGGVAVPALIYVAVTSGRGGEQGWAIPTATDIAFAVAALGLIAPRIPQELRVFLLTLAVVDDLIAIVIIASVFTSGVSVLPLMVALLLIAVFGVVARLGASRFATRRWAAWAVLLPIAVAAWAFLHASGMHATIAGVLLAAVVPISAPARGVHADARTPRIDLAERFIDRFSPLASGLAVPVFAFFAAGVPVAGASRFPADPIAVGVILGLVVGKPLGISLTTWALTRFTRAELGGKATWREIIGVACLAGVGFTVALLVADLSFPSAADADTARLAVLAGSLVAIGLAAAFLIRRPRARPHTRPHARVRPRADADFAPTDPPC